jgi:hypothetical protein
MEDRLKYILGSVNEWLKFAEAKNAALLVATSALVLALVDYLPDKTHSFWNWALFITASVFFLLSSLICLLSFVPQVKFPWIVSLRQMTPKDNLFFFGDIANYSAEEFVEALYHASTMKSAINKLQCDLAGQIITNSRIGLKKFRLFTVAV